MVAAAKRQDVKDDDDVLVDAAGTAVGRNSGTKAETDDVRNSEATRKALMSTMGAKRRRVCKK